MSDELLTKPDVNTKLKLVTIYVFCREFENNFLINEGFSDWFIVFSMMAVK